MEPQEFRVIPGYAGYGVTNNGMIKSWERNLILNQYVLDGYLIVDTFRGSLTETLPVHRAVALAWVDNSDQSQCTIVNHKDGNRSNNWHENLEWTTYSGNNYHAVNTGLRSDNITCQVRDFFTKQVTDFNSMAQAAEFMGLPKDAPVERLRPKKFGALIANRYEFRYASDETPWFYEHRSSLVPPSRFMVLVRHASGQIEEVYSNQVLIKNFQLYGSPSKSIPGLVEFANTVHPDKEFRFRDSYAENMYRHERNTRPSVKISVVARHPLEEVLDFDSLTQCANYFQVDRSVILSRISSGKTLDGWTFTQAASHASNGV